MHELEASGKYHSVFGNKKDICQNSDSENFLISIMKQVSPQNIQREKFRSIEKFRLSYDSIGKRPLKILNVLGIPILCTYHLDIIKRVRTRSDPPFRPAVQRYRPSCVSMGEKESDQELYTLMKMCFEEQPDARPSFPEIKKYFKKIISRFENISQICIKFHYQIPLSNSTIKFHYQIPLSNSTIKFYYQIPLSNSTIKFHYQIPLSNSTIKFHYQIHITKGLCFMVRCH